MKPSEYYFQLVEQEIEDVAEAGWFLVTGRDYFDQNGYMDYECGYHNTPMPEGFGPELMECTFEFQGDPQVGRKALLAAGFVEKQLV